MKLQDILEQGCRIWWPEKPGHTATTLLGTMDPERKTANTNRGELHFHNGCRKSIRPFLRKVKIGRCLVPTNSLGMVIYGSLAPQS